MKVLVPLKMVIDHNVVIQLKNDRSGLDIENLKTSINPFDENAIEEAVSLKEQGIISEVITVTCGSLKTQQALKTSLAMGADRSILFLHDGDLQPLAISKILKYAVEEEKPDFVIMGKQAIDDDSNQTGQMLAGLLNWPQVTFVSNIRFNQYKEMIFKREVDYGYEILSVKLPAIITVSLDINAPRYVKLHDIIKAKKKQISIIDCKQLNLDLTNRFNIINIEEQCIERSAEIFSNIDNLIYKINTIRGN